MNPEPVSLRDLRQGPAFAAGAAANLPVYDRRAMDVRFYATLRPLVGGKTVTIDLPAGASVRHLLEEATRRFPALGALIWTPAGDLGEYIKVFVNGREIRHLQMLDTPLPADASVDIFPPVAGGAR